MNTINDFILAALVGLVVGIMFVTSLPKEPVLVEIPCEGTWLKKGAKYYIQEGSGEEMRCFIDNK